jgi:hypothetical protein
MQDTEAAAIFKLTRQTKTQVFNALVYMDVLITVPASFVLT